MDKKLAVAALERAQGILPAVEKLVEISQDMKDAARAEHWERVCEKLRSEQGEEVEGEEEVVDDDNE